MPGFGTHSLGTSCSSVVARFSADGDRDLLEGTPALFCLVSEQMAATNVISMHGGFGRWWDAGFDLAED